MTQVGEQGGNIAKVAALYAGLPASVPGITVNRYCTSGLDACSFAAMKIATGMDALVLAGGVECMSRVPMLSDKATFYSDPAVAQKTRFVPMGLAADLVGSLDGITREECGAYAVSSQQRAARAQSEGRFAKSLVAVQDPASGGLVEQDECVRPGVTTEKLAAFEPLFTEFGKKGYEAAFKAAFPGLGELNYLHHAGNSPAVVDGASLVALGSRDAGEAADLHKAFARIYCEQCGHDYLLAYSCKTRYFCPSCHQKRMLTYGEWLEDNVLAPVPHRQYVFALPKLIRPFFRYRRRYLGELCRLVAALLKAGFKVMAPHGQPAFVL